MRTIGIGSALVAIVLVFAASAATAPSNDDELLKDEQHFLAQSKKTYTGGQKAAKVRNMAVVGQNNLGGRGFNADVWVHEGYAYVGHWGFSDWTNGSKTRFCPSPPKNGIAVVDATDPARPGHGLAPRQPDGYVGRGRHGLQAKYGPLAGRDIAAVGIQVCGGSRLDPSFPRGLMLFDVTNPASPTQLGFLSTGCCTRGLHELEFGHRDDLGRTFIYASVPASEAEEEGSPSGFRDLQGRGDFRLIDVTNPTAPFGGLRLGRHPRRRRPAQPGSGMRSGCGLRAQCGAVRRRQVGVHRVLGQRLRRTRRDRTRPTRC